MTFPLDLEVVLDVNLHASGLSSKPFRNEGDNEVTNWPNEIGIYMLEG